MKAYPHLGAVEVAQRWAGYMDVTPDAIPVISGAAALPGLFIGTGFSGHGFGIGPAVGKLIADLVTNDTPLVDLHLLHRILFAFHRQPPVSTGKLLRNTNTHPRPGFLQQISMGRLIEGGQSDERQFRRSQLRLAAIEFRSLL